MKHVFEVFVKTWSKLKNWTETEKSGPKLLKIIKAKNNDFRAIQIHENDLKLFRGITPFFCYDSLGMHSKVTERTHNPREL